MSTKEDTILNGLKAGNFLLSLHAARRMKQRSVTDADIRACGRSAERCRYHAQNKTWRVDGTDLDGEKITVICAFNRDIIIVTIF